MSRRFIILTIFPFLITAGLTAHSHYLQSRIDEKPMKAELVWSVGSDEKNEDFYKPSSFAIDSQGRVFILDSGNSRIQCFSPEGTFLFSFGRGGQGPGELSKEAEKIRILEDENIYVIDNRQRRINVYDRDGKFLRLGKSDADYDDIILVEGTYFYSNLIMVEGHIPIHCSKTLGKIDRSFGPFIDPDRDLLKRAIQMNIPKIVERAFSSKASNLLVNSKKEIVFSPFSPYRLIKFDMAGNSLRDIAGQTDFYTGLSTFLKVDPKKRTMSIGNARPSARLFQPFLMDDDQLAYFYLNPGYDTAFLDLYNADLGLTARYKMPNTLVDFRLDGPRQKEYLGEVFIDRNIMLYALIKSQEDPPRLVKYKLTY
ncbi:MAG: 6-bladed beta-propeller [Candidatus Aminicenantes bacterium]|nr:6-bladed beta-propeller [Candidatus Aminicenantes bacterium]